MGTIKVACRVVNGIKLRLFKQGFDDGTGDGQRPTVVDGAAVTLKGPSSLNTGAGATAPSGLEPVINEVDQDFITRWLEQNAENPLRLQGMVYLADQPEVLE